MITPRELFKLALESNSYYEVNLELIKLNELSNALILSYYFDFKNEIKKYRMEETDRRNEYIFNKYEFLLHGLKFKPRSREVLIKVLEKGGVLSRKGDEVRPDLILNSFTDWEEDIFIEPIIEYILNILKEKAEEAEDREFLLPPIPDAPTGESPDVLRLPIESATPEAEKYKDRAIERGFIKPTSTGLRWQAIGGERRGNAQLGYFLSKIYSQPRPINALERLFDVKKLSTYLTNAENEAMRSDVMKWRTAIDEIFID